MVVPVRIDGLEQDPLLAPVARAGAPALVAEGHRHGPRAGASSRVDPALKGKARRQAAGAALYEVMSDLVFRTTPTDRTVFEAVVDGGRARTALRRVAVEDPVTGPLTYKRLLVGAACSAASSMPLAAEGGAVGVMLPNANGAAVTILGADVGGPRAGDDQLHRRRRQHPGRLQGGRGRRPIVTSRAFVEKAQLEALVEALGAARHASSISRTCAPASALARQAARASASAERAARRSARPTIRPRSCSPPAREGVPKGVVLSHRNMLANAAQAAARIDFGRTDKVFNVLPVFHSFGLTVGLVLPLVSGVPRLSLPLAAALPDRFRSWSTARTPPSCSAPTRSWPATRAPRILTISARCATCSPAPSR